MPLEPIGHVGPEPPATEIEKRKESNGVQSVGTDVDDPPESPVPSTLPTSQEQPPSLTEETVPGSAAPPTSGEAESSASEQGATDVAMEKKERSTEESASEAHPSSTSSSSPGAAKEKE